MKPSIQTQIESARVSQRQRGSSTWATPSRPHQRWSRAKGAHPDFSLHVIGKRGTGLNRDVLRPPASATAKGVERIFPYHSPRVGKIWKSSVRAECAARSHLPPASASARARRWSRSWKKRPSLPGRNNSGAGQNFPRRGSVPRLFFWRAGGVIFEKAPGFSGRFPLCKLDVAGFCR